MCWQADEMLCDKIAAGGHAERVTGAHRQVGSKSIQRHLMLCRQGQCEAHRTDYQIHSELGGS